MQKIVIAVKQVGKKHPVIAAREIDLRYDGTVISLKQLLTLLVQNEVERYDIRKIEKDDIDIITKPVDDYADLLLNTGKAGFDARYNPNNADLEEAVAHALQAFEDGLFAVFYGDDGIENLLQEIDLSTKKTFTLIRLTFLSGSIW